MAADFLFADFLADALIEILLEDVGFEGAAGFRRDDAEGLLQVEFFLDGLNLGGIGGIEHVKFGVARKFAKGEAQNFDAKAGAPHAEKECLPKFSFFNFRRVLFEVEQFLELITADASSA